MTDRAQNSTRDGDDERAVAELRRALLSAPTPPPGLESRLEAAVLRDRRATGEASGGLRVVVAAVVFSVAAFGQGAAVIPVAALLAGAYAWWMAPRLVADASRARR